MAYKRIFPSNKITRKTMSNISELTNILVQIINNYNWQDKYKYNNNSISNVCFFYVTEFYRQVMCIKYSNFCIKTIIKTILIIVEDNCIKNGDNINKKDILHHYIYIQKQLSNIYSSAKINNIDEFDAVAMALLQDFNMSYPEVEHNLGIVEDISALFRYIINYDIKKL